MLVYVSIFLKAPCKRVVRAANEGAIKISDIKTTDRWTFELVLERGRDNRANLCIYGGELPCQGVPRLSAGRLGIIFGQRSSLFFEFCRVARDLESMCQQRGWASPSMGVCRQ